MNWCSFYWYKFIVSPLQRCFESKGPDAWKCNQDFTTCWQTQPYWVEAGIIVIYYQKVFFLNLKYNQILLQRVIAWILAEKALYQAHQPFVEEMKKYPSLLMEMFFDQI